MSRGILPLDNTQVSQQSLTQQFQNPKELESYFLANESSFLNEKNLDEELVGQLNVQLDDDELNNMMLVELDPDTKPYKDAMLNAFRDIEDPFGIEIMGQTGGANFDSDQIQEQSFFDYE